ncbi:MAG TPA: hypothetical protein VFQ81_00220 [Candidatus Limnocylindria bacterium]|nr:hypothetical protein [Candidatus Limnocylindria bacterium]
MADLLHGISLEPDGLSHQRRRVGAKVACRERGKEVPMDLIWIIVIVLIVLALLGYFGRGRLSR